MSSDSNRMPYYPIKGHGYHHMIHFKLLVFPPQKKNIHGMTIVCLHINLKARVICIFNFVVESKGLLKVTGSHMLCKS